MGVSAHSPQTCRTPPSGRQRGTGVPAWWCRANEHQCAGDARGQLARGREPGASRGLCHHSCRRRPRCGRATPGTATAWTRTWQVMGASTKHQTRTGCSTGPGAPVGTPWREGGLQHLGEGSSIRSTAGTSLTRQLSGLEQVPGDGVSQAGPTLRPRRGDCSQSALVAGDTGPTHARHGHQPPRCRTVPWGVGAGGRERVQASALP